MSSKISDISVEKVENCVVDNIYTVTYTENGKRKSKEVKKGSLNIVKIKELKIHL